MDKEIKIDKDKGPVSMVIEMPSGIQTMAGRIHRYNKDEILEKEGVGIFSGNLAEIPIGVPADINEKYFLVWGGIAHHNDKPPTQYQVVLSVKQGDTILFREIPEGWSGQLSNKNIPLKYIIKTVVQ